MKLLIVIDVQNDFITGPLGSKEAQHIIPLIKERIETYINNGDKVVFTRDTHTANYLDSLEGHYLPVLHCIEDTEGWEVVPELAPYVVQAFNKSRFGLPRLKDLSIGNFDNKYESIELVGVCTDICVISNALILKANTDIPVVVNSSCCAGTNPTKHWEAIDVMKSCQVEVI